MKNNQSIPAVNFHLWGACNMRCKYCFATFQDVKQSILPQGHLSEQKAISVVKELAKAGFTKITFAGGEPTLCTWLPKLIRTAKQKGMTTMIVTNGTMLNDDFLQTNKKHLDWIAISIDSLNTEINLSMGRAKAGINPLSANDYESIVQKVKQYGYGLKINTVVNSYNFMENMNEFINLAQPKRWKIMQMLPIIGQNDNGMEEMHISTTNFEHFVQKHNYIGKDTVVVSESNEQMQGSYAMVDPAGRFFDNANGFHHYSRPIIEVGVEEALKDVKLNFEKFSLRGGLYDWKKESQLPTRITLSGQVASGKTTIGKLLAQQLSYDLISIGNKTRELASKMGLTIVDFQKMCSQNPEIDKNIDKEFSDECNSKNNLIIDYRLGFKFIDKAYNIFLKTSSEVAIERLKLDNRINETHYTIKQRNELFQQQFFSSYNVDIMDESHYDLVINTDDLSPEEIVDEILIKIK
jgi:radical S-adenosyl methionine domain-containing protein 2